MLSWISALQIIIMITRAFDGWVEKLKCAKFKVAPENLAIFTGTREPRFFL